MIAQILEAWRISSRISLRLIDRISDEGMRCTLSKRGGRPPPFGRLRAVSEGERRRVVRQFSHLHNVRVGHLTRRAKHLAQGPHIFDTYDEPDKRALACAQRAFLF